MNKARITNIRRQQNGKKYANVLKRERWVHYLKEHELRSQLSPSEAQTLFDWASSARIDYDLLQQIILHHSTISQFHNS